MSYCPHCGHKLPVWSDRRHDTYLSIAFVFDMDIMYQQYNVFWNGRRIISIRPPDKSSPGRYHVTFEDQPPVMLMGANTRVHILLKTEEAK